MKIHNTSERLRQLMAERGLRQVDILEAAKPYCEKYGVKLGKNDLSQYTSGKVEPGQEKLSLLGMALGVSEAWLMGYDVSIIPDAKIPATITDDGLSEIESIFNQLSPDNRAKLLELSRLYLTSQSNSGERQ